MTAPQKTSSVRPSARPELRSPAPSAAVTGLLFLVLSAVSLLRQPIGALDLLFAAA